VPWDFAFDWNETRLRNTAPAVRTLLLLGNIVSGVFTTVLAKTLEVVLAHRLHSVGVDRMQRNFELMRKRVEAWPTSELTEVTAFTAHSLLIFNA
jgi:hypothetical protein